MQLNNRLIELMHILACDTNEIKCVAFTDTEWQNCTGVSLCDSSIHNHKNLCKEQEAT